MNKKKILGIMITGSVMLFLTSCKKGFFDINQSPNSATETVVTPDLLLAPQLTSVAGRNASTYDYLQRWMGYWSASGSYSPSSVEWSYNITTGFATGTWTNIYYTINQLKSIEKKSNELGWKFYEGITKILQAHETAILVDFYNNIPYSQGLNLGEYIRPQYDDAESVYKSLIPQIDEGLALIKAADGTDRNITTIDIMYKGNATNWAKFANTLKLRLLIHTSLTTTFDVNAEMAKINSEGSGFLGGGLGATVQPGYTPDKPNPYYNAHFYSIAGVENDNYNRANNFSLNLMKDLGDNRYKRFYRETKSLPGQWRGTDYGQSPDDDVNSDRTSGPGYGITANASAPMWIMSSVEAMFLRAEATARGWISGDAETAYRDAVKESFTSLGIGSEADAYLSSVSTRVAWPASGLNDQIAVIMWQKYFALNGIQANETYNDYRRLGIVQPPLSVFNQVGSNKIPGRLLYPQSEYDYNTDNVTAQGTINAQTAKVFWDK